MPASLRGAHLYVCPECGTVQYRKVREGRPSVCEACEHEVLGQKRRRFEELKL